MSEKGGKGSSLLSKGSLKGKDDSATKSSKGRRVQFSKEGPFESGITSTGSPASGGKGEFNKGGKGDKVANGKANASKSPSDPGIDQKLPENIKCLMDCEAADILHGIQEQMVMLSRDSTIKIPISFDKGLHYASSNSKYSDSESVRRVLQPLKGQGFSDNEICMIANMCPETVDEVFALVPSVKDKGSTSQVLQDSLHQLSKLKQF
ncbi:hypothetical protein HN51_065146 [Arachis hypogaea]|uniref:RNA polymerase Rpb4/RPC9 core domain-containing protein n=1 Tax=Arachis hypogaea TaxID=3818 RepID=A0A444ZD77_ARAHY|nr:DNA-directed RNA polymerases IV and V subunit 4 [Arachis ipaensis]XP_016197585.1 DNA-directed RNA polymerases IV and V subunit 4 [Arachis ipaensis]XP_025646070.1 DNA-directed RNA polymerases IV and V subunit 4 [Arachis hypogaea]XP_025646071.1 DNA-directed RNA polymerases IV and V subunit 4 [Arachis hypogaea]QHO06259.1 DNA-directed RNA polymerases IV and V subunit [Arachis hypogaea]RYR12127.1 hypothetical protein Ahy_B04g069667 isoform A [Arachis hypogaea]